MSLEVLFSSRISLRISKITAQTRLQESEPFIPYKALLIALSSVNHTAAMSCTATMNATVAAVFSPDSTNARYGSSLAFAGFPHTNEHLYDHVFIIICLVISKTGMKSQMMLSLSSPETAI